MTNGNEAAELKSHYEFAATCLYEKQMTKAETLEALKDRGIEADVASKIIQELGNLIQAPHEVKMNTTEMLHGALWCIGGTVATLADFGFIFWGAIVFGAIQFFRGMAGGG